jgi:hypothetical protein
MEDCTQRGLLSATRGPAECHQASWGSPARDGGSFHHPVPAVAHRVGMEVLLKGIRCPGSLVLWNRTSKPLRQDFHSSGSRNFRPLETRLDFRSPRGETPSLPWDPHPPGGTGQEHYTCESQTVFVHATGCLHRCLQRLAGKICVCPANCMQGFLVANSETVHVHHTLCVVSSIASWETV